jgi:hypothetical protein
LNDPGSTSLDVALPSGRTATFGYAVRAIGTDDAPRHIVTFQDITQLRALRDEREIACSSWPRSARPCRPSSTA